MKPAAPQVQGLSKSTEYLASLLVLQKKMREAKTSQALQYLLVNDLQLIVPYRSALVWRHHKIASVSGLPTPVAGVPFTLWANDLCRDLEARYKEACAIGMNDVAGGLQAGWGEFFPAYAFWFPTGADSGLLFTRDAPWNEAEIGMLRHAVDAGAHALNALEQQRPLLWKHTAYHLTRKQWRIIAGVTVALMLFPVRLSISVPAEISGKDSYIVRAPLTGIVEDIVAKPNSEVHVGDLLLTIDDQELKGRREVANQALAVALSEYNTAQQEAITSSDAQAKLNALKANVEQKQAEMAYIEDMLQRVNIASEADGIVLIADPNALKGKPVRTGEKLMTVADPAKPEIEMWVPVADNIELPEDAVVKLYLNNAPNTAIYGTLTTLNYKSSLSPEGVLSFRATASIEDEDDIPRLGLRGTAKIYGYRTTLFYYLFRKPLTFLRERIGL